MIVVHTSCFDESTELEEMLKIIEQKQDFTHLHLHHLSDAADEGGSNPVSVQIFSASPAVQYFHQNRMYERKSLFSLHKLIV